MFRVKENSLVLLDQVLEAWVGLTLPRPIVALGDFSPTSGCMWCGRTIVPYTLCECTTRRLKWVRVFRLGVYAPPLSICILQGKYTAWPEMLELLGRMLGERINGCVPPKTVVVPVPMPRIRRWFRRIDHAAVIARYVAKGSGLRVCNLLIRKESTPQAALTASSRRSLPLNTMRLRRLSRVRGRCVLLVDDVLTTGRTLEIAADTLKAAGATCVMIAVVAVTELPSRIKKM